MAKMADKMYGSSPKMERDEKSGDMKVKKKAAEKEGKDTTGEAEDKGSGQEVPMARHAMDRLSLHHKHENEHMAHKGGDKKEMHKRHQAEMASMHKSHEKEHTPEMGKD